MGYFFGQKECEEPRQYQLCAVFFILMAMIIKNELIIFVDIVAVVGRHRFLSFHRNRPSSSSSSSSLW